MVKGREEQHTHIYLYIFEIETYFILMFGLCLCATSKKASHSINNLAFYLTITIKLNK